MAALTIGSFFFFTALVGAITWFLTRGTDHSSSGGYFLAGRSLSGGFVAGSLLLTNLSTEQLVGLNGSAFTDGISVMAWEVVAAMSLVVLGLFFLPRYLKSGVATVPQFLEERFDGTTRLITSIIFIFAYALILLPIILYTGATGLVGMLDIRGLTGIESEATIRWGVVWMIGLIGSVYAIFGGLRTVAVSDTLNGFGLLIGGVAICVFGLAAINGNGPVSGLQELQETHPQKFNSLGGPKQSVPFSTLFTGVLLLNLFYWTTNQQIIQRTFAAKNLKEGQKGVLLAGLIKVLAPLILVIPGIAAFHLYGQVVHNNERMTVQKITSLPMTIVAESDGGETLTFFDEQASEILGTDSLSEADEKVGTTFERDGVTHTINKVVPKETVVARNENRELFYLNDSDHPIETENLVSPDRQDQAYGTLVRNVLPNWLTGFFAAAIVGAILSSFNSVLNSSATLFSLGIYKQVLRPKASEVDVIRSGKIFGWTVAISAMIVAPLLAGQASIFSYLQKMNGLYFIPILAVMAIGMLTRRVPAVAAKTALIAGIVVISLGYFVPQLSALVDSMNQFHFLGAVFIALIAMMLIIGVVRPRDEPWVQRESGDVDLTQWRWAKPVGFGLIFFVVILYVWFANTSVLRN